MSLVNTKSLLAKLLASENLTIEHGNYETASMDVKNRVLRLPIWKEMSGSLYDLMVLHEVGHALYTPEDGWHESASDKGAGYKSFLNVVEDARIEKFARRDYPGLVGPFLRGYKTLIKNDFFGSLDGRSSWMVSASIGSRKWVVMGRNGSWARNNVSNAGLFAF